MSHILDLTGAYERRFLLQQLALASKGYCKRKGLNQADDNYGEGEWASYFDRLQFLVSKYLVESAVSMRILGDLQKDVLNNNEFEELVVPLDRILGEKVGSVIAGDFKLTLRESCNKIVHAVRLSPQVATGRDGKSGPSFNYWNGMCDVKGERQDGKPWHLCLDVYRWCEAIDRYVEDVPGSVDWR